MKYIVTVEITRRSQKEITVYAGDEATAEEKACDIVLAWEGVDDADALSVEESE